MEAKVVRTSALGVIQTVLGRFEANPEMSYATIMPVSEEGCNKMRALFAEPDFLELLHLSGLDLKISPGAKLVAVFYRTGTTPPELEITIEEDEEAIRTTIEVTPTPVTGAPPGTVLH